MLLPCLEKSRSCCYHMLRKVGHVITVGGGGEAEKVMMHHTQENVGHVKLCTDEPCTDGLMIDRYNHNYL